ncbi:MAG: hypothetical protein ACD_33C00004G0004 [uncultured bacterium]|nr:MAG: hypothetical protein ACD_33C00004G0004 [uncultured bacterium]
MSNPNNCSTCDHIKYPDDGHCYMFKDIPTEVCMQHTGRKNLALNLYLNVLNNDLSILDKKSN